MEGLFKKILNTCKEYKVNIILASFFILAFIIYLSSNSYSDFIAFYTDWKSVLYLMSVPFISIVILKFVLDEKHIEKEVTKDSTFILIGVLTVITLILTLFNPTTYEEVIYHGIDMEVEEVRSDLLEQKQIHYPMMYLIVSALISFLSKHKKVKATFVLSSLILMFVIFVDIMNFKESFVISMGRGYLIANWDIVGSGIKATVQRILKVILPLCFLYITYQLIGKNKL